ncbi:MAG: glycosyltransferase [Deltaproteobacteria bacterium]|nr:glycosyltransferase [Deltaproteobacteria bacterium]
MTPAPSPLRVYRGALAHGPQWPPHAAPAAPVRVGYHLWRYPALTTTYIHREIAALRAAGLDIVVFAEEAEDAALLDAEGHALVADAIYLQPLSAPRRRALQRRVLARDRLAPVHALAHARRQPYAPYKNWREDRRVFRHALALAGCALERGVTHLHSPWAHLSAFVTLLAAYMAGVPYSVQARASTDLYRTRARGGLAENLAHARFVVTNCELNRRFIAAVAPGCRAPVHRVYEGLDPTRFVAAARRRGAGEPLRVLSVGRLSEEKGFEYLLQALALLRAAGRDVRAVIVGGGAPAYAEQLIEARAGLGLDAVVELTGALPFDRVLEHYQRADVFALASTLASDGGRDVTPNVLIEAMAMQLPVVATRMTAIPELVEDRVSGILVPPRHPQALAAALARIADDPDLAATLGINGRRRVEERFDMRRNARQYLALFDPSRS